MLEATVKEGLEDDIVHFYIESNRKYLFVAYRSGSINVYEIGGLMHYARDFKMVTTYEIKNQATTMQLHAKQRVLFVGDNEGLVNLIDTKSSDTFSSLRSLSGARNLRPADRQNPLLRGRQQRVDLKPLQSMSCSVG